MENNIETIEFLLGVIIGLIITQIIIRATTNKGVKMTREVARRWAKEIAHFGNGGNLWSYNFTTKEWDKCVNPIFDFAEGKTSFVIEDKSFDARKAFALGETIQSLFIFGNIYNWYDYNFDEEPNWGNAHYNYKPKPKTETRWQWLYSEIKCKILQLTLSHYATSEDAMRCLRIEGIYAKKDLRKLEETKKEFKC